MDLFRDYQGHIQNEISIVEFYDHQNWLLSCKCRSYDKRTFILNAVNRIEKGKKHPFKKKQWFKRKEM